MSSRLDIFIHRNIGDGDFWPCYVQAVTPSNARNIAASLERQGERVRLFTSTKCLGRMVYETPRNGE